MEFKVFNAATQNATNDQMPKVSVTPSNGVFFLSAGLVKMMGLLAGQTLSIAQDTARPQDWYLFLDESGMSIRDKKAGQLILSNRLCAQEIASSMEASDAKRLTIKVGEKPVEKDGKKYFPLVTKGAVIRR